MAIAIPIRIFGGWIGGGGSGGSVPVADQTPQVVVVFKHIQMFVCIWKVTLCHKNGILNSASIEYGLGDGRDQYLTHKIWLLYSLLTSPGSYSVVIAVLVALGLRTPGFDFF